MPITVTCTCGKQYQVANEHAGKSFTCKACNTSGTVPPGALPNTTSLNPLPKRLPVPNPESSSSLDSLGAIPPTTDDTRTCPACAESVKAAATKCRYCGCIFDPEELARINLRVSASAIHSLAANKWVRVAAVIVAGLFVTMIIQKDIERRRDEAELLRIRQDTQKHIDRLEELRHIKRDLDNKGLSR